MTKLPKKPGFFATPIVLFTVSGLLIQKYCVDIAPKIIVKCPRSLYMMLHVVHSRPVNAEM
jgi:hypothetical protein